MDPGFAISITGERPLCNPGLDAGATTPRLSVPVTFVDNAIEVGMSRLDLAPEVVTELAGLLSREEKQRAHRFAFDRDRRRFTVARALLRKLLAARLSVRPENVELKYSAYGKPALARRFEDSKLHFNVSHSEDVAVYAFSWGREIGIDVEAVRVIRDADDIAARFFSRVENETYRALDAHDKPLGFFNCWTRKEAFIKAIGQGLHHPLERFDVSLAPSEPARILRVGSMSGDECGWRMDSFSPAPGFVAAVVTESQQRLTKFASTLAR